MRHWIIANGASLNVTPLEMLIGETTWAMNRIHLMYPHTRWRPTYYFMVDFNQQNKHNYWHECIWENWDTPKWLWDGFRHGHKLFPELEPIGDVPNTTWIPRCEKHHYYAGDNFIKRAESWHLPKVCTAFSGIGAMMQLAVLNGATELCIVGADLYEDGGNYNHNFFDPRYQEDTRPRAKVDNTNMVQVHTVAKRSSPVPIYNCTFGGKLEVYERKDFYRVLNG